MRILTIVILLFTLAGCTNVPTPQELSSPSATPMTLGGRYCAEVTYDNPSTGKHSVYTLQVDCAGDQLLSIHWPDGGELDADHFTPPTFDVDSTCSFTSDNGTNYSVYLIGDITVCQEKFEGALQQCKGTTQSGEPCKRMTDNESGYCWQHEGK